MVDEDPTHDKTISGAPRGVYVADVMTAAPDDEVCDIAIPIAE